MVYDIGSQPLIHPAPPMEIVGARRQPGHHSAIPLHCGGQRCGQRTRGVSASMTQQDIC